jgi:hypothetical protein
MLKKEAISFIEEVPWVYAKSYAAFLPHYYTTRDRVQDDERFELFIEYMRENATIKAFHKKQYLYFELDGFEYWEMGRPKKAVQVINKAQINDNKSYRLNKPSQGDQARLLSRLKERDKYVDWLLDQNRSPEQEEELKFLMNSKRKSPNIMDHSDKPFPNYVIPK